MIKTSMGVVSGHVWLLFCVFLGFPCFSLVMGNASLCLELGFARVSAQVEPLASKSDQNKVFDVFSERFWSLFLRAVGVGVGVVPSLNLGGLH